MTTTFGAITMKIVMGSLRISRMTRTWLKVLSGSAAVSRETVKAASLRNTKLEWISFLRIPESLMRKDWEKMRRLDWDPVRRSRYRKYQHGGRPENLCTYQYQLYAIPLVQKTRAPWPNSHLSFCLLSLFKPPYPQIIVWDKTEMCCSAKEQSIDKGVCIIPKTWKHSIISSYERSILNSCSSLRGLFQIICLKCTPSHLSWSCVEILLQIFLIFPVYD